jgi:putative nucleotidyltransferase with HDIG domain
MMLLGLSECVEALDYETALNLFRQSISDGLPFDLVTLEIGLADREGGSILKELRTIENQCQIAPERKAFIMVITALSGRQLETDCILQGCNDFITKPVETKQILARLARHDLIAGPPEAEADPSTVVSTTRILDTISRSLKRGDLPLPPAPRIAMKIRQLVTCSAEMQAVVDLLKQDPAIATRLISVSNSAFYRGVKKSTAVDQAVRRLGIDRTMEVVMSICCRGYFVTNHAAYKKLVEELWWHCLACAHTTEMVSRHLGLNIEEDFFSLGLLHDIGKLVLIQVAGDLAQPKKYKMDIHFDDLQSMMTAHHRRFGASVLKKWGYPKTFTALIQRHWTQDGPSSSSAQVLHQAHLLAKTAGFGHGVENTAEIAAELEQLGYSGQLQEEFKAQILARMEKLRYAFG